MKKISIIIPIYNEEKFIAKCLDSILSNSYPKELTEIIIIDGLSNDKSIEIVKNYMELNNNIKLLINEKKIVPISLNIGINEAKGEYIIRIDAHTTYPSNYFEKLIYWSEKLNADNVGGIVQSKCLTNNLTGLTIENIMSHKFGVGDSQFRIGVKEPKSVDTVPFGCFKKTIFEKIGYFDERLERNQDIEFNKRILKNGGKIYLIPEIVSIYHPRSNFTDLWLNRSKTGMWIIQTAYFTNSFSSLSLRHFIPLIFVLYLISLLFLPFEILYLFPLFFYSILNLYFSLSLTFSTQKVFLFFLLFFGFFSLHISYGLGSLKGLFNVIKLKSLIFMKK